MHKILIIDDEYHIRLLLEQALEELEEKGVEFYFAENGREGLEMIMQHIPQLVFLDIMMPELNGYEVCRRVKKNMKDIYIVLLSAKGQEFDKALGYECGADEYVTKPFDPDDILAKASKVLGI